MTSFYNWCWFRIRLLCIEEKPFELINRGSNDICLEVDAPYGQRNLVAGRNVMVYLTWEVKEFIIDIHTNEKWKNKQTCQNKNNTGKTKTNNKSENNFF